MQTERLFIRNFKAEDWHDLYEYLSQKEVLKYEPEPERTEEECKSIAIERSKSNIFWAVIHKESRKMIGHVYFCQSEPKEFLTWEIGYIFNPKYYRYGYATEASRRIMKYGFEQLGAHRIIGMCNPENTPSWKLLERLSMRREAYQKKNIFFKRTSDGNPVWLDTYQYAMLSEEWNSK